MSFTTSQINFCLRKHGKQNNQILRNYHKKSMATLKNEDKENIDQGTKLKKELKHFDGDDESLLISRRESLSLELFSPLRGEDSRYSFYDEEEKDRRLSSDGLFSPIREPSSDTNLIPTKMTPLTCNSICDEDDLMTSSPETENIDSECISVELLSVPHKISFHQIDVSSCSEVEEKSVIFDWDNFIEHMHKPVKLCLDTEIELVEDCQEQYLVPILSSTQREDCQEQYLVPILSSTQREDCQEHYQHHYIRKVVSEVMEDWYNGVERRIWEMQYSFIRQLQRDQEEIKVLMNDTTESDKLNEELELAREENKELRKFFGKFPGSK